MSSNIDFADGKMNHLLEQYRHSSQSPTPFNSPRNKVIQNPKIPTAIKRSATSASLIDWQDVRINQIRKNLNETDFKGTTLLKDPVIPKMDLAPFKSHVKAFSKTQDKK